MFNRNYTITICMDHDENGITLPNELCTWIKTENEHVYCMDGKLYYGFTSKIPIQKVAKLLEEKIYKCATNIVGGTIILTYKD